MLAIFKYSNFFNLDIGVKSSIKIQCSKYNSLIFLLFSKNNILEICVSLIFKISKLSNLDKRVKSLIFSQ